MALLVMSRVIGLLSIMGFAIGSTAVVAATPLNVLMIVADDLRPMITSFDPEKYASMSTPNLDALSSDALMLRQSMVQQVTTNCSSHPSISTDCKVDSSTPAPSHSIFKSEISMQELHL
jgi:hypothetical protein